MRSLWGLLLARADDVAASRAGTHAPRVARCENGTGSPTVLRVRPRPPQTPVRRQKPVALKFNLEPAACFLADRIFPEAYGCQGGMGRCSAGSDDIFSSASISSARVYRADPLRCAGLVPDSCPRINRAVRIAPPSFLSLGPPSECPAIGPDV